MKKIYFLVSILILLFIYPVSLAQTGGESQDKYTLLTEPFNIRSLNLYKGQLQFNAGYNLAVRTKSFDNDGAKIGLAEDGSASIIHNYQFNLRYGVLDYIEIGARMNYIKQGIRGKTSNYFSGPDFITVNELSEYNGFEDLKIWTSIGPPLDLGVLDFSIIGGISIPTAKHMPDKPTHTRDNLEGDSYLINYHYNLNNGEGVPMFYAGTDFKLTFGKISLVGAGSFSGPVSEGESMRWKQYLSNNTFVYGEDLYTYLADQVLEIDARVHYQALSWLDVWFGYSQISEFGGWTEQYNLKYANPELMISYIQAGLELQISPLVRLKEVAGFALSGQNMDAPFYILTSLSFNLFTY